MGKSPKHYVVKKGRKPGIYENWYGPGGAEEQVRGYPGAWYKSFTTRKKAEAWLLDAGTREKCESSKKSSVETSESEHGTEDSPNRRVIIYTDGSSRGNPGPGGYGVVILDGGKRKELARGYRLTTNNRMELMACIAALESVKKPSTVVLYTDSSYVANGINLGWAKKWRAHGWMRTHGEPAMNADLWDRLLTLCENHSVRFVWVRGHAGNTDNERCDKLALAASSTGEQAIDEGYERHNIKGRRMTLTENPHPTLQNE